MDTLLELIDEMRRLGGREALRFFNGYRRWVLDYRTLLGQIGGWSELLREKGLGAGDRLIIWSENRPEWVSCFWACVSSGIQVVPIDHSSSADFVNRIRDEVDACLLVCGAATDACELSGPRLLFDEHRSLHAAEIRLHPSIAPDDIVQIVYTSGTTGKPKGMVHRHRNICANLTPVAREIVSYKAYARPFQPIRILDLLPLSHLFGQALGLFVPVLLGGATVFVSDLRPGSVLRAIRSERVSVLVAVPRLMTTLRQEVKRQFVPAPPRPTVKGKLGILQRFWRYRHVHSKLGWKFWALCVGGAEVSRSAEDFWSNLGYAVIQGYGMTETSPVVAANHPLNPGRGSIGKVLPGQEVKVAADGEILVRGENVVTALISGHEEPLVDEDGWLHSGDVGELDSEGRLYFKGRKKDLIVTSDGLNVYPQDVEEVLNSFPGIKASVVFGRKRGDAESTHAVLLMDRDGVDGEMIVQRTNSRLEPHQRIRGWSVWPEEDFPRTSSTFKIKRHLVIEKLSSPDTELETGTQATSLESILSAAAGRSLLALDSKVRLDEDLGLSSLDRVELMSRLEEVHDMTLEEESFASVRSVGDLSALIDEEKSRTELADETPDRSARSSSVTLFTGRRKVFRFFDWHGPPIRLLRNAILRTMIFPLFGRLAEFEVSGEENLAALQGPVLFVANHTSHFDTVAVLSGLPAPWNRRLAPAMRKEYFLAHFRSKSYRFRERWASHFEYLGAAGLFAGVPLPQRLGGIREALERLGELVDRGYNILLFPEGRRSPDGKLLSFQKGVGLMALRLQIPVVPIALSGPFEIYSVHHVRPQHGRIKIAIGTPVELSDCSDESHVADRVEQAFASLAQKTFPELLREHTTA